MNKLEKKFFCWKKNQQKLTKLYWKLFKAAVQKRNKNCK